MNKRTKNVWNFEFWTSCCKNGQVDHDVSIDYGMFVACLSIVHCSWHVKSVIDMKNMCIDCVLISGEDREDDGFEQNECRKLDYHDSMGGFWMVSICW